MTYQKVTSSIVSEGAMNTFNEMFQLARMFPLAKIHRGEAGSFRWAGDFISLCSPFYYLLKDKNLLKQAMYFAPEIRI